jgi:hypothetical protein
VITTEQNNVPSGLGSEVCFDKDDHIEWHRETLVQELGLVNASLDPSFYDSGLEILLWDVGVVHPFSMYAFMTLSIPRKAQSCIPAQLGDQV